MVDRLNLSYTTALILQVLAAGYQYGFDIMDVTGLPSGTVYPALRRLEHAGFIGSRWESEASARREPRPPRKYYQVTRPGKQVLAEALKRYRTLEHTPLSIPKKAKPSHA